MRNSIRVGITGATGFIGTNLAGLLARDQRFRVIPGGRGIFANREALERFVAGCDEIVHLAAISRDADGGHLYRTNMLLVSDLISAMEKNGVTPRVLFASTTHHLRETPYHASKRDGAKLFDEWAERNGGDHCCLLMPNAFGPHSRPFYNSVTATFACRLARGEKPEIIDDAPIRLIPAAELCSGIINVLAGEKVGNPYVIPYRYEIKVSELSQRMTTLNRGLTEKGQAVCRDRLDRELLEILVYFRALP